MAKEVKRKRENKLNTCCITQQFQVDHWSGWTLEEQVVLERVRQGSASVKDLGDIIISRLEKAGIMVSEAYIINHNKDMVERWDDTEKRYVTEAKSNHMHFVCKFATGKGGTIDEIAMAVGLEKQYVEKTGSGRYAYDNTLSYLIHIKYTNKYQYPVNEVVTLRGTPYDEIYSKQRATWLKGRSTVERKSAAQDIDDLEYKILQGAVTRSQVFLTDDLFKIYSRYKRRCDDAFQTYAEQKAYKTIAKLNNGEFKLTVYFIVGAAGSGKTNIVAKDLISRIENDAKTRGEIWQHHVTGATNVLDGYMGEEILLMDDVRGTAMRPEDWLKLLDPYTISESSARYHNKVPACRVVIITSTIEPNEFFSYCRSHYQAENEAMDQFIRRIQSMIKVIRTDDGNAKTLPEVRDSLRLLISDSRPTVGNKDFDFTDEKVYSCDDGIKVLTEKVDQNNRLKIE